MRKYSMSEEAKGHVLLRLTYLLACLLHTIITIRVVSNAGLSRSVRMSLNYCHFIRPVLDLDLDNNCQSPDGYFGNGFIYLLR